MTPALATIQFRDIDLRTGVRLRCAETGPRDGQPILLLHGYSDSWFSFSSVLESMDPEFRLILPSQRGHGDSDRPEEGYSPDDYARDAIALLERLGLKSATVIGHSMGSFVAQRMAALAPPCVARLVLIGSSATARTDTVRSFAPVVQSLTDPMDPQFVREFQQNAVYRPVPEEFMERAIAESLKLPARIWKEALSGMLSIPFFTAPGEIRCPTAIFWGERDAFFHRSDQEELLARIPGARLEVFSAVGHTPHWEVPEEFVRRLRAVL